MPLIPMPHNRLARMPPLGPTPYTIVNIFTTDFFLITKFLSDVN